MATDSISQAFFSENSPAMFELEGMVDRGGIRNVLYALAKICDGKAEPHCIDVAGHVYGTGLE